MNAQRRWKQAYHDWMRYGDVADATEMRKIRREAGLERRIESLERENKRLQELLDMANYAVWHDRM